MSNCLRHRMSVLTAITMFLMLGSGNISRLSAGSSDDDGLRFRAMYGAGNIAQDGRVLTTKELLPSAGCVNKPGALLELQRAVAAARATGHDLELLSREAPAANEPLD